MNFGLKSCMKNLSNTNVIGTKWIFKNKFDEFGNIVRNKARLVTHKLGVMILMRHLLLLLG